MKHFFKTWFLLGEGAREWENGLLVPQVYGSDTKRTIMGHITHMTMFAPAHSVLLLWAPWWALIIIMLAFGLWRDWNNLAFPPKKGLEVDAYWDITTKILSVGVGYLVFFLVRL